MERYLRLGEIFMMILEKAFAGLSVKTIANLHKLPSVMRKLIFSRFCGKESMNHL